MKISPSRGSALLAVMLMYWVGGASAAPAEISAYGPIACGNTPFGLRMPLGLEQEYLLVHAGSTGSLVGVQSSVHEHVGSNLTQPGNSNVLAGFATAASIDSTPVDLDGDGKDEWAVAGIKTGDAHTVVVTTYKRDLGQAGSVLQQPVWEWTSAVNVLEVKIAAAEMVGRKYNTRQQLAVSIRDASETVRVLLVDGDENGIGWSSNTALLNWTMPAIDGAISNIRLATGDVLLEGYDQIVMMALSADLTKRIYYVLRYDLSGIPHLSPTRFFEVRNFSSSAAAFDLQIADLGGTPAAEMVVHDQPRVDNLPTEIRQSAKYFTTTRDSNNVILTSALHSTPEKYITTDRAYLAVAVGELDGKPGTEIVLARQHDPKDDGDKNLWIELYAVDFSYVDIITDPNNPVVVDTAHPVSIGPYLSPTTHTPIRTSDQMFVGLMKYLDVTIGDADADGIGEIVVAAKDQVSIANTTPIVKLRSYSFAPPAPNDFPDPNTFARTGGYDFPSTVSDNLAVQIDRLDFDGDSLLADIGTTCKRIHEPMLRSVVHLPPYWTLLQGSGEDFLATIGKTYNGQTSNSQSYGTFTSHDISGYIGVSVGGDVLGAGAKGSAKVTAGYNYQSSRGETFGTQNAFTVGESQSVHQGEGLVVVEDNTFDCYSYDVRSLGVTDPGSNIRSCELIDGFRSISSSDLVTWDSYTASNGGAGSPQWIPLAPDWASIVLFRVPTANFAPVGQLASATDGQFASSVQSPPMTRPYVEIDLGGIKSLTNVRIFPPAGKAHAGDLDGFSLYASAVAFPGASPPTGPNVAVFAPDPSSGNGFDHWNIWLRNPGTLAPRPVRYLRLQAPALTSSTLSISEIQVFADVHIEPPGYPQAVCDPIRSDGIFTALMYDGISAAPGYRKVDVRGQLLWSGAVQDITACGDDFTESETDANDGVQHFLIWQDQTIQSTGVAQWDLAASSGTTVGKNTEISHSARVGVELDVEAGAFVKATIGGAYEFSNGITEQNSTTMYWGTGLQYAGAVGGLPPGSLPGLPQPIVCAYRPQPYAYTTHEFSNIGYEQQFTVVDYVVRDLPAFWTRGDPINYPPNNCYVDPPDRVFRGSFE